MCAPSAVCRCALIFDLILARGAQVDDHLTAGMMAVYEVLPCALPGEGACSHATAPNRAAAAPDGAVIGLGVAVAIALATAFTACFLVTRVLRPAWFKRAAGASASAPVPPTKGAEPPQGADAAVAVTV